MEEKELQAKDIPMGYPLCFNEECHTGSGQFVTVTMYPDVTIAF